MPTYQYRCKDCGADLEVVQKFTDPSLTECPHCEHGELRKVYNAVGVVFKGSGFYRTDSREKPKSEGSGAASTSDSGSGSDGASKADAGSGSSSTPSQSTAKATSGSSGSSSGSGTKAPASA